MMHTGIYPVALIASLNIQPPPVCIDVERQLYEVAEGAVIVGPLVDMHTGLPATREDGMKIQLHSLDGKVTDITDLCSDYKDGLRFFGALQRGDSMATRYPTLKDITTFCDRVIGNEDTTERIFKAAYEANSWAWSIPPDEIKDQAAAAIPAIPTPTPFIARLAALLRLDEATATDWLIAKAAAFRGCSEADVRAELQL